MTPIVRSRGKVVTVERRERKTPASQEVFSTRLKPKLTSVAQLQEIAAGLRDMPRECACDRAELLLWLSRQARQIDAIALEGFEARPRLPDTDVAQTTSRQRFLPAADARVAAEAVFAQSGEIEPPAPPSSADSAEGAPPASKPRKRRTSTTTVRSRKGKTATVEVRRGKRSDPLQTTLF